jgi:uncharacterized membrane protein
MRFFGWVFLIVGIFSVLLMPILGLLIIIIGAILLSVGWKGKDRKDAKKARMGGDIERAEYLEVKAKKYE